MTGTTSCPQEFSDANPENTPCNKCGSRIHYTLFDGLIRCSFCDSIIDKSKYDGKCPKCGGELGLYTKPDGEYVQCFDCDFTEKSNMLTIGDKR